jgi:dethiobiotin synthetase
MNAASHHLPLHCNIPVLFVTGTDTAVGKTRVACALIAAWRRGGRRVAALKPIETGCDGSENALRATDGERLAAAAGLDPSLVCPERFPAPASPEAAAALAGRPIRWAAIVDALARVSDGADALVVEGAGGLRVPIDPEREMADLAVELRAHLLVVARASLGTVNHSLLTLEAAARRSLPVAGVVLNRVVDTMGPDEPSNPAAIAARACVTVWGTLPFIPGDPDLDTLAALARRYLDPDGIWRSFAG